MPADLLFAGGPILTMATPSTAEALAVRGGRIHAVGSLQDCRARIGSAKEVDLAGRSLMPAFVDAHCHPILLAQARTWTDVAPGAARSIEEMVQALHRAAELVDAQAPVRAFGYDQRQLAEQRHPTARDLDQVSATREVYVMHTSGHGMVVNSAVLRRCGIDRNTHVDGGFIGRDDGDEPDGRVFDAACDLLTGPDGVRIRNHGPNFHLPLDAAEATDLLDAAQDEFLSVGITAVGDAQVSPREMEIYLRARHDGRLRMRVEMVVISAYLDQIAELGLVAPLGDEMLGFAGIKLYADGSLIGMTAYFPEGYTGDPAVTGHLYHRPDDLSALIGRVHQLGLQARIHALSPVAIGIVLDAIEAAERREPRDDARHAVEHCGLPTDEQIERMARLDVYAVLQPQHPHLFGDGAVANIGEEMAARYYPGGLLTRGGCTVVLSSDAPVAPPRPFTAIRAAAERRTTHGRVLGDEDARLTIDEALRGYTIEGARVLRREGQLGSLEVGKLADFAVLDRDPTVTDLAELDCVSVVETWMNGGCVHEA